MRVGCRRVDKWGWRVWLVSAIFPHWWKLGEPIKLPLEEECSQWLLFPRNNHHEDPSPRCYPASSLLDASRTKLLPATSGNEGAGPRADMGRMLSLMSALEQLPRKALSCCYHGLFSSGCTWEEFHSWCTQQWKALEVPFTPPPATALNNPAAAPSPLTHLPHRLRCNQPLSNVHLALLLTAAAMGGEGRWDSWDTPLWLMSHPTT